MAMWRTVIRSGQVVPVMKAMVPAKAILNKNLAGVQLMCAVSYDIMVQRPGH